MPRISILLAICTLLSLVISEAPPSFCKCTCLGNSTIIQLDRWPSNTATSTPATSDASTFAALPAAMARLSARASGNGGASCSRCNRAFCLQQGIPSCKNSDEKDVFTTCFQRDSRKDQIIVLLFIAATVGLLAWAGLRRVLERRRLSRAADEGSRGEYAPVGGGRGR